MNTRVVKIYYSDKSVELFHAYSVEVSFNLVTGNPRKTDFTVNIIDMRKEQILLKAESVRTDEKGIFIYGATVLHKEKPPARRVTLADGTSIYMD